MPCALHSKNRAGHLWHKAGHDEFHYRACFMVCIFDSDSLET